MKLIYARAACSLSVHILLEELGVSYVALKVGLKDKKVLESYNPKSYVPALILDDGTLLTEAISILQFLSETHGGKFMPQDQMERAKCIEWLSFVSSELHKGVGPLFHRDDLSQKFLGKTSEKLSNRLMTLDEGLERKEYLVAEYSIADMYALAILRIMDHVGVSMEEYSNVVRYKERLEARPLVQKVLKEEEDARMEREVSGARPVSPGARTSEQQLQN